ncbi:Methylamine utilisation protein MauE [Raineyella antarctica]|uniref:Methylamine utilisation protein MauE n=1 Tax=Raineyella antarctica TaxID=1577474 RepID=A0A1G6GVQ9_9ACTN|nr:MauE/DoxX family redox-associated membrane protein [Raineyella antarctica]SDB86112.1 Methylamine utilisation protein MauE [Raineyella antarctica]
MLDSLVLAHLVVAVTLVVAAVGKWRHPDLDDTAFAGAGLPEWINSAFVRRWHPVAELVLGLGMILVPAPWNLLFVVGGAALVAAYLVLVVVALRAPEPVSCGCFGADDSAPVSGRTLARNVVLALAAAVALVDAALGGSVLGRLADATVWGWLAGALLAVAVTYLATSSTTAAPAGAEAGPAPLPALPEGEDDLEEYVRSEIPDVEMLDPDGHSVNLRGIVAGGAQLLVFLSPGCGSCLGIARDLPRWRERDLPITVRPVVHSNWIDSPGTPVWVETALVDQDGAAAAALEVRGTPGAVLLGADGLLAGGPVLGAPAVREFYVEIAEQLEGAAESF